MTLADRLRSVAIQRAYDAGKVAEGQQLNIEAGVARGGSLVSGGAMLDTITESENRLMWGDR